MNIISLFDGVGGLDLGFHHAGFQTIWETFEKNFSHARR